MLQLVFTFKAWDLTLNINRSLGINIGIENFTDYRTLQIINKIIYFSLQKWSQICLATNTYLALSLLC